MCNLCKHCIQNYFVNCFSFDAFVDKHIRKSSEVIILYSVHQDFLFFFIFYVSTTKNLAVSESVDFGLKQVTVYLKYHILYYVQ